MKLILQLALLMGVLTLARPAAAQSGLTPDEYSALVAAVESTTPQPASEAPLFGNFYTITHGESWPPLPADTMGLNYWPLGGNFYLLDDREVDYSASRADLSFGGLFPTNGGSGGGGGAGPDFSPQYTSNDLYLTILGVTSNVASLKIHPPPGVTDGVYDLFYRTNPLPPDFWHWIMRTAPGQTSLLITNASDPLGFYRLGARNYWLAFPYLYNNSEESLSVYITSASGATGSVLLPNQGNAPVLTLVNTNSDPAVLGTYTLTNAILNPATYFLNGAQVSNYYVKGHYLIFFDNAFEPFGGSPAFVGWVLVDSTSSEVLYTGPFNVYVFNDFVWTFESDSYSSGPTNICAVAPYIQPFSVAAGFATNVPIPNYLMMNTNDAVYTNASVAVTADGPVSVYALEYFPALTATFTVYPASLLGTNYRVMARPSYFGNSEFAIVATADNTTVWISPSTNADLSGESTTNTYQLTMQAGQSYENQGITASDDVTGTLITSDKPIAVFAGATDALVPDSATDADNPLMQEQFPINEWDTNALALSFMGRTGGDSYRVLAAQNNTAIYTNGVVITTNQQAGVPLDFIIDGPVQFSANKPIQVAHFANGRSFDPADEGDPCEILLPAVDRYLETNIVFSFGTTFGDFDENYLNIIVLQSATNNTFLDGTNLLSTNFVPIGASGYFGARILMTNTGAAHRVASSQPVGVEAYGWGNFDAYGYFGGIFK